MEVGKIDKDTPVYIAGHRGLVGSAIWRKMEQQGFSGLTGWDSHTLDLRDHDATFDAIMSSRPEVIVVAAARVGGIVANTSEPVQFLNDNLRIQTNLFEAAHAAGVNRLMFLGSSCIYPKMAQQPIRESSLMTGLLEETNRAYAVAKIAGIEAIRAYREQYGRRWIAAMPTNLYGPGDNFDLQTSHVLPSFIRKFHEARESSGPVELWGTGRARREFLHVDDLAAAVLHLLDRYDSPIPINVGVGKDISILSLAALVADITGYCGELVWDTSKPDGTPRKLLDTGRLQNLGWRPRITLPEGIASTYDWYSTHLSGQEKLS